MAESASGGIIVGVDGSPGSRHALEWLVGHRSMFDGPIIPVVSFDLPVTADGLSPLGMLGSDYQYSEDAERSSNETVAAVDPTLLDSVRVLPEGHAGKMLIAEAEGHELLVVGCRGRSAAAETLLGSVGSFCVSHSKVPVAIIPKEVETTAPIQTMVVGIDGSANSQAALQWAVDHAKPETTIKAVGVYSFTAFSAIDYQTVLESLRDRIRDEVETSIAKVNMAENASPTIIAKVLEGDPRNVLREEAADADLLVLGARGHRGVAHLILGSVTTSLTHHPTAVTVVVPSN